MPVFFVNYGLFMCSLQTFKLCPMFIKGLKFPAFITFACLVLVSCQKEIDLQDPDIEIPPGVLDSTLLVKSLERVWGIGTPEIDSSLLTFNYDTVNRKISIRFSAPHADPGNSALPDGTEIVHSYNDKGLLSHILYNYPSGYIPYDYDYKTVDIVYDADKIVKSIAYKDGNDVTKQVSFTKTALAAGSYKLSWVIVYEEADPSQSFSFHRSASFTADGKNILNTIENFQNEETSPSQFEMVSQGMEIDSLVYDANGSVSKIFKKLKDENGNIITELTSYDFTKRYAKGDQLYNQRQAVLNGIANIPFGDYDEFGIFYNDNIDLEFLQYSKYPIQQTIIGRWQDMSYYTFNSSSSFDSKDRLAVFRGFFNDFEIYPEFYKIAYYK